MSAFLHAPRGSDGGMVRRPDIDIDHAVDRIRIGFERIAADKHAGIYNENIQGAAALDYLDYRLAIRAICLGCLGMGLSRQRLGRLF